MGQSEHLSRLEAAQAFVMRIGHRDFERGMGLLSDNVTYKVHGHRELARGITGRDAVAKHLVELVERSGGGYESLKWVDWMVGNDHVAAIAQILVQATGQRFEGPVLFVVEFDSDDKIDEIVVFAQDVALHILGG